MSRTEVSTDEMIATLQRSRLPTVITEGSDEAILFRCLEERVQDLGVSMLPVGGRTRLLEIFARRAELTAARALFIADLDLWVFGAGVPPEFVDDSICYTDGYSIENDLYRDGDVEALLRADERKRFQGELEQILDWFAAMIAKALAGDAPPLKTSPYALLDPSGRLKSEVVANMGNPSKEIREPLGTDYAKLLRGKTLMSLLSRQLSHSARTPKHSHLSLLETSASRHGPYMVRFESFIRDRLMLGPNPPPASEGGDAT